MGEDANELQFAVVPLDIDAVEEDAMEVDVQVQGASKALDGLLASPG